MKHFKKTQHIPVLSALLIFLLFFQADLIGISSKKLEIQLNKAKVEYNNQNYRRAAIRLERLAAIYANMKEWTGVTKIRYGQTVRLLSFCQGYLQQWNKAQINDALANQLIGKNNDIPEVNSNSLNSIKKNQN